MAAVLSSCQKSELESVSANDGKDIVLNISVSNPGVSDTKALIKTGWAANDEISIWYDGNNGATPDLVIKHNGTKWIQKEGATVSGKNPSTGTGKYAKALYNGTVKVASKDTYTYENSILTFSIENWKFLTEVQVVVKGLTSASAGNYTLACDKFFPLAAGNGYTVGSDAITSSAGTKGNPVTGISNTDGVAFVFATADYSSSSTDKKDFAFTLKDNTSGSEVTKVYKPNVAIEAKENKSSIKALTIESSSFTVPGPEYVVMKMGTSGNRTLKWATMNLGATTVAGGYRTCYGDLYQWGSVNTLYNGFPWTSASAGSFSWKSGKGSGFVSGNREYTGNNATLPNANDVVKKTYPGTNWRMPTSQEFKDLYDACGGTSRPKTGGSTSTTEKGVYWCTSYNGVAGLLFCDGTNRVFFPAAGYGDGTTLTYAGSFGTYWSSSIGTGYVESAYRLGFNSSNVYHSVYNRHNGFSVRPVSN